MKSYRGRLTKDKIGGQIIIVAVPGEIVVNTLKHKQYHLPHIVRHSPDGFNWGYSGSGPADTALSILTDCLGPETANVYYQEFKFDIVAGWENFFEITEIEIREWLKSKIAEK